MAQAGTYGGSAVPDPTDTTNADNTTAPVFGSFDDLSEYGVAPALANLNVMWKRNVPQPVMADEKTGKGEVPAYPARTDPNRLGPLNHTYQESVRALYKLKSEEVGGLQTRLIAGGFMGKNPTYVANAPDKKTRDTWDEILKMAMRSDKTPDEVIQDAIDANGGMDEGLKKYGPGATAVADVHLTHPDDIRMVAKQISTKTLGRGWNNQQLDAFVKTYQAMQSQAGQAARDSGATIVNAPSLEASAEAEARRQNPTAAGAADADGIMQMVTKAFSILGGSSNG